MGMSKLVTIEELVSELVKAEPEAEPEEYECELWGSIVGIAGRFLVVSPLNPAALWPVGTALYVRRVKE